VEARAAMQAHVDALFPTGDLPSRPERADGFTAGENVKTLGPTVPTVLPRGLSEPLWEEMAQTQAARQDWIAQEGRPQREVHGRYLRTADVRISTTDPDATPLRLKGGCPT
jgi:hypothetical protein